MTKQKAVKILKELIKYKKNCVDIMNTSTFSTDLEDIRVGMIDLAQRDQETLEKIIKELEPNARKKKSL